MKVNEIFYSIQGEGYFTGKPAVFIRLSGCNLSCKWCDTKHTPYKDMRTNEIITEVNELIKNTGTQPIIVITGGEPTIQDYEPLVIALRRQRFFLSMESNGTFQNIPPVDWLTLSPKSDEAIQNIITRFSIAEKKVDEIKIVYEGQSEEWFKKMFSHRVFIDTFKYIQPCFGMNESMTIDRVKRLSGWNLSIQTQKYLSIL